MRESDRFILYRRGETAPSQDELARISATPGLRVIDQESPNLMLVECSEVELRRTLGTLKTWSYEAERTIAANHD